MPIIIDPNRLDFFINKPLFLDITKSFSFLVVYRNKSFGILNLHTTSLIFKGKVQYSLEMKIMKSACSTLF